MPEPRPALTVVEGGAGRPRLLPAAELMALGTGLTFTMTLLAGLGAWRRELPAFQALMAVAFAFYGLALARLSRYAALPHAGLAVFAVALAARAALLPVPPSLSDDVYRYVWEGRVLAAGRDPYREAPAAPALSDLRDSVIYPRVNHPQLAAIYPPLALAGFAAVARVSATVGAIKAWVILHDLALTLVLMAWLASAGQPVVAAIAYAWNPLVLAEYAGSGHHEPTALLWMAAAFLWAPRRPVLSGLSLAVASLVRLAPLVALPALWVRWPWRARLACLVPLGAGLAFYGAETRGADSGLRAYWSSWRNNELVFHGLERLVGFATARAIAIGVVVVVIAVGLARRWTAPRVTQWAARAGSLVTPVLHPWYLGWVLMFEPFTRSLPWLVGSFMALMAYGVLASPPEGGGFHLSLAWRAVEYGVPFLIAVPWTLSRRRRPSGPLHVP